MPDLVVAAEPGGRTRCAHARPHVHVAAEQDVVEHRHAVEERQVLERARDAEPRHAVRREAGDVAPVEHDRALLRRIEAGDRVGQRGLAAAVRPDQAEDLAAR